MEMIMSDEDQKMLVDFVRACADRNLSSFKRSSRNIEREFDTLEDAKSKVNEFVS
jgi:hypothetical protein